MKKDLDIKQMFKNEFHLIILGFISLYSFNIYEKGL